MESISFYETQKFTQWWLWTILIGILSIPIYQLFNQFLLNSLVSIGTETIITLVIGLLLIVLFCYIKLVTFIDEKYIILKYSPLIQKTISWNEVEKVEIVDYGFVGGWGVRWGSSYGTIYSTKGRIGLALTLKDGTKLVIGTQKKDEMEKALKNKLNNFQ